MAESILIVNGATRINGNTDILVGKIIDGAKNAGLNLNLVELKNKNISNESKECGF
jgi:multimeric flavodoxin WrbA